MEQPVLRKRKSETNNINVGIRVRPPLPREIKDGKFTKSIACTKGNKIHITLSGEPIVIAGDQDSGNTKGLTTYTFDRVFDGDSTQDAIYTGMIEPSVKSVVNDGFNATVFAYGQTGSGKTFTMQGDERDNLSWEKTGMIQRAVVQIFAELAKARPAGQGDEDMDAADSDDAASDADTQLAEVEQSTQVFVSIYQIYNENINDLLSGTGANLKVREHQDKQGQAKRFQVDGLKAV